MKDYSILEPSPNVLVIVLNNSLRINHFLDKIRLDLHKMHFQGLVYVDLLLTNGLNSKRFFKSYCNNETHLKLETIPKNEHVPHEVIEECNNYFMSNRDLLDKGILTDSARNQILYS